jgi:hypothetical protein
MVIPIGCSSGRLGGSPLENPRRDSSGRQRSRRRRRDPVASEVAPGRYRQGEWAVSDPKCDGQFDHERHARAHSRVRKSLAGRARYPLSDRDERLGVSSQ